MRRKEGNRAIRKAVVIRMIDSLNVYTLCYDLRSEVP